MVNEIKRLETIIKTLDTAYHTTGEECRNPFTNEIITDNEYDQLKKKLKQLDPNNEIFTTVFASQEELIGNKIVHNPPMTSISKCNGIQEEKEETLLKWMRDCITNYDINNFEQAEKNNCFSMSYKHDGIALSLEYENGKLMRAGLRSKSGVDGIDCTAKAKVIKGIPTILSKPLTLTIRGEIETDIKTFAEKNTTLPEKDRKTNPRAYTAGAMNRKTAAEMKDMGLRFIAYNILNFQNPPYKTEIERAKWAEEILGVNFVKTIPFTFKHLNAFEQVHRQLDFMVDGVVISINDLNAQVDLGTHGNRASANPKGKIAWKFADEIKTAIVTSIEWQTGRTGTITPVLNFDGIQLEGTTVSKCTAHNLGIIKKNKIGIGSKIAIIKSGKIIPKIKEIIEAKGEVLIPNTCPTCGEDTREIEGCNSTESLICDNINCPAQNVQNLDHYLKRIGVKGIAESTIAKLCESELVEEPADFYKLTLEDLINIGFKERSATLILARIRMVNAPEQEKDNNFLQLFIHKIKDKKISIKLETLIAALGIDGAGRELGRILAENYNNFEEIRALTIEQLSSHDGIGHITASNVVKYFQENNDKIDRLLNYIRLEVTKKKTGNLEGKQICLSGIFPGGKNKWKKIIEDNGGKVTSSVSKKIDYLVASDGSGSKSDKARKFNIPIITVDDLEKMI